MKKITFLTMLMVLMHWITTAQTTVADIISNSPDHTTLTAAVNAADLTTTLQGEGPFTVFAPTDGAFAAIPQEVIDALLADPSGDLTSILLYHVVAGTALSNSLSDGQEIITVNGASVIVSIINGDVFINNAQVTVADLIADNGVVHVIDAVLLPPTATTTVMDIIEGSDVHETLEAVLGLTGLDEVLRGEGPFTVFAPTDAAFSAIPQEVIDALLADPSGDLTSILLYHVVAGTALSSDLADGQEVFTVNGAAVTVSIVDGDVFINGAQVIVADLIADNGVVHVIDAVLLPPTATTTVMDIIEGSDVHETLEAVLGLTGLDEVLRGEGPFTVFAPTDAAFSAIPQEVIDALLAVPSGDLTSILLYHVVAGTALSSDLADGQEVFTVNGAAVTVSIVDGDVFINGAQVIVADLIADNGVVHVIDAVLLPPTATTTVMDIIEGSDVHETLEAVLGLTGLDEVLRGEGPFTVFAPTDAAFSAIPQEVIDALLADPSGDLTSILLYHVVAGTALSSDLADGQEVFTVNGAAVTVSIVDGDVFINGAQVIVADLIADNGVVHVIDAVLLPPADAFTVMDIIAESEIHETLEAVLTLTGLDAALRGTGPFTVFAPTDAAFGALPEEVVTELLNNPEGELTRILLYHVVNANALSTDLSNGQMIQTLLGQRVTVTINEDGVFINNAQVVVADLEADNGVVHVIDAILLPQGPATVMEIIENSPVHETLEVAINAAGLADALRGSGPFTVFAPTDEAFEALPDGLVAELLEDPTGALAQILLYHVVGARAYSTDLSDGQVITTLQGQNVVIRINDNGVFVNDAEVIITDLEADNGVVHVINAILLPDLTVPRTIYEIISESEVHTTLTSIVDLFGLDEALSEEGLDVTLFAPTDAAFAALGEDVINALLSDPFAELLQIIRHHLVEGIISSEDLFDGQELITINGQTVTVRINDNGVFVDDAQIIVADIVATNGIVHVIDAILLPELTPCDITLGVYFTFNTQFGGAPSPDAAGNCETFALNFEAWASEAYVIDNFQAGVLYNFSICEGPNAGSWDAQISVLDVDGNFIATAEDCQIAWTPEVSGTYIILINEVGACGPASVNTEINNGIPTLTCFGRAQTVMDIIEASDIHNTLEAAINAAGLNSALRGEGPFTVFAPTDAVFEALPDGLIEQLLADPSGALTQILLYHVVNARALSTDLTNDQQIVTLNGQSVTITLSEGNVFVNDAQVIVADLEAENGVVHVINAILLPTLSTNEVTAAFPDVKVYPNPVSTTLFVDLTSVQQPIQNVRLMDVTGRTLQSYRLNAERKEINVSTLQSGAYFLEFIIDGNPFYKKVMISK